MSIDRALRPLALSLGVVLGTVVGPGPAPALARQVADAPAGNAAETTDPADATSATDAIDATDASDPYVEVDGAPIGLLREGSVLIDATGTVRPDPRRGGLVLELRTEGRRHVAGRRFVLALLPCGLLSDFERMIDAFDGRPVVFRVTGEVFVFEGRNYLLPTIAPEVVGPAPGAAGPAGEAADPDALDDDGSAAAPAGEPGSGTEVTGGGRVADDSVAAIRRELDRAVGPVRRRADALLDSGSEIARVEEIPESLRRDGERIVERRGRLIRDGGGAWVVVLDADAQGLEDPPLTVLPCRLLERMAAQATSRGMDMPVVVTGRVFRRGERHHLLPSIYRIPREARTLTAGAGR